MNKWKKLFTLVVLSASFSQQMVFAQQNQNPSFKIPGQLGTYRENPQGGGYEQWSYGSGGNYWKPVSQEQAQRIQSSRGQSNQGYDQGYNQGSNQGNYNQGSNQNFGW